MSSDSAANFEIFGDYVLLKQLAAGGMAEVFLARPVSSDANGRIVVIKRILRQVADDPLFIKMFRAEIRVTLGFNHPHTIQIHDFGEINGQPYIAMEFIDGKSLREIADRFLRQKEAIPVPTVLGLLAQAASGLSYAHHYENSVTGEVVNAVHRDISPQNLIVSYDGNLKVIDFGIAKAKNEIVDKTRAGQIKGKCGYLSPEQLEEEILDGRSDIFSLGIVAWELLTQHRLFHKNGDTEMAIMQRIQHCDQIVVAPSKLNPDLPPEVDRVILKALHRDRNQRYPTAAAFQVALRRTLQQFYPSYSYSDTAQLMKVLFEKDIAEDRRVLRELNERAQEILVAQLEAETKMVEKSEPGLFGGMLKGLRTRQTLPNLLELKVANLETVLKQRATTKHFVFGMMWVISLIGIKLDERYSLLDRFFLPAEAETGLASSETKLNEYRLMVREKYGMRRRAGTLVQSQTEDPRMGSAQEYPRTGEEPSVNPVVKAIQKEPARVTARAVQRDTPQKLTVREAVREPVSKVKLRATPPQAKPRYGVQAKESYRAPASVSSPTKTTLRSSKKPRKTPRGN